MDSAVAILKGAYEVFLEIKGMQDEIVANQKSLNLLISRFSGVAEDVKVLAESGSSDNVKLQPARNFALLMEDARDFSRQFCKNDHVKGLARKALAWATKAYNRKEDRNTLEEFLRRLDACSRDLNLRVTMDIKQDTESIARLLQEDGDAMRDMLEKIDLRHDEDARRQEEQFHVLKDAIDQLANLAKHQQQGPLSFTSSSTYSEESPKIVAKKNKNSWCAMLPAVEQQFQYVDVNDPHDPVDEDDKDDASLGEGAFGEVFLAKGRLQEDFVAIKLLKLKKVQNAGVSADMMRQEASNLRRLTHLNIIRMWGECQEKNGKFYGIVMEYAAGGSVLHHIKAAGGKCVPQTRQWLLELGEGLRHMHHECRMQHRDLKPHNLLLDARGRVKIADLGLACAYQTAQSLSKQGTTLYMSPEKADGKKYGTMDDMWAVGCILIELWRGEEIGPLCPVGLGVMALANPGKIKELAAGLKEGECPFPDAEDVVLKLLQVQADERLGARQLVVLLREGERLQREGEERLKRDEEDRLKREEEEPLKKEEEERLKRKEEERLKKEEEEQRKREEERLKREEEERLKKEEEDRRIKAQFISVTTPPSPPPPKGLSPKIEERSEDKSKNTCSSDTNDEEWHVGLLEWFKAKKIPASRFQPSYPKTKADLLALKQINANNCNISGEIPKGLGNCINLEHLWLNNNKLSGNIPKSLGNCIKLEYLGLYENQLSGSIPESLGNCTKLEKLFLYQNRLEGNIPNSLGKCTNLRELHLYGNQLSVPKGAPLDSDGDMCYDSKEKVKDFLECL